MPRKSGAKGFVESSGGGLFCDGMFPCNGKNRSGNMAGRQRRSFRVITECSGYMVEVPLVFTAYAICCVVLFPYLARHASEEWAIAIILLLGITVSFLLSLLIHAEPRLKVLRVPVTVWSFLFLSLFSGPFMIWLTREYGVRNVHLIIVVLMIAQPLLSVWMDYRSSLWWQKRESRS